MDIAKGCVQFNLVDYVDFLKKVLKATDMLRGIEESELNKWKNDIAKRTDDLERIVSYVERRRLAQEYNDLKEKYNIPMQKVRRFFDIFKKEEPQAVVVLPTWEEYQVTHLTAEVVAKALLDAINKYGSVNEALHELSYDYRQIENNLRFEDIHKSVQTMFDVAKTTDNTSIYLPLEQVSRLSGFISEMKNFDFNNNSFIVTKVLSENGNGHYCW